jgi:hypothetical protein
MPWPTYCFSWLHFDSRYWDKVRSPDILPKWILMLVGIVGTIIAVITLFCIKSQMKDTNRALHWAKRSAIAAKKSANALINSERAWIFADIEPTLGQNQFTGDNTTSIYIRVRCKNVGRSPAWITQIRARFEIVETLPDTPPLEVFDMVHAEPQPMAPGGDFITNDATLTTQGIQGLDKVTAEIAVVYGVVLYRDTFADNYRTTFGYRLIPGTNMRFTRLNRYPKYNENT